MPNGCHPAAIGHFSDEEKYRQHPVGKFEEALWCPLSEKCDF